MRPDLDDFEEMNQDTAATPRSRAMSWLVLGVAVTGFAALAYYAYQSGTRSLNDSNILEVAADAGDIKEAPADAGGEEFPHQDKTIYDVLTDGDENQKVEKLLPEPEEPVMPEPAVGKDEVAKSKTTTFVNRDAAEDEDEEEVGVMTPPTPVEPAKPDVSAAPAPVVEAAKTAEVVAPVAEPVVAEPVKEEVKPAPAPVEKPKASSGSFKIQLGAFTSEAEAQSNWKRITKKHGSIVKGSPIIVRYDDPSKGTFYRLRASGFASAADAKAACAKLEAAGQPCFPAGK